MVLLSIAVTSLTRQYLVKIKCLFVVVMTSSEYARSYMRVAVGVHSFFQDFSKKKLPSRKMCSAKQHLFILNADTSSALVCVGLTDFIQCQSIVGWCGHVSIPYLPGIKIQWMHAFL